MFAVLAFGVRAGYHLVYDVRVAPVRFEAGYCTCEFGVDANVLMFWIRFRFQEVKRNVFIAETGNCDFVICGQVGV